MGAPSCTWQGMPAWAFPNEQYIKTKSQITIKLGAPGRRAHIFTISFAQAQLIEPQINTDTHRVKTWAAL